MTKDNDLQRLMRIVDACSDVPQSEQFDLLITAAIVVGQIARNEVLAFPGQYEEERAKQAIHLRNALLLVETDEPDIEGERMFLEGDFEGWLEHLKGRRRKLEGGEP